MVKLDNVTLTLMIGGAFLLGLFIYWFFLSSDRKSGFDGTPPPQPQHQPQPRQPSSSPGPTPHPQGQGQPRAGPVLVLFYGNHCPHCHSMMQAWGEVKQALAGKIEVKDIEGNSPEMAGYVPPKGVPTIRLYPNGVEDQNTFMEHKGDRSAQSLMKFAMTGQ